jgi:hypothetical protein
VIAFRPTRKTLTVAALGTTQTFAWASSYYLPAILAGPIAAGLHVSKSLFYGFFSVSLLLQAALGPAIEPVADWSLTRLKERRFGVERRRSRRRGCDLMEANRQVPTPRGNRRGGVGQRGQGCH